MKKIGLIFILLLFFVINCDNSEKDKNKDLCENVKCENGSCKIKDKKATCDCNRGYKLENSKCVLDSCTKNRDCPKSYTCIDKACVPDDILCEDVTCSDHGKCKVIARKAHCRCDRGYFDKGLECLKNKCKDIQCGKYEICEPETGLCKENSNPCKNVNCGKHGKCEYDKEKNASCNCEDGYVEESLKCIFKLECTPDPKGEICGDGLDNNCDGTAEESCDCNNGDSLECYTGVIGTENIGECKKGTMTCPSGELWTECTGEVIPQEEICDGKDNDCNNTIDKSPNGEILSESCYSRNEAELLVEKGRCKAGKKLCNNGKFGKCTAEVLPIEEVCGNSIDDDCDGEIDEGCSVSSITCSKDVVTYIFGEPVRLSATTSGTISSTTWSFVTTPNGTASELNPTSGYNTSFIPDTVGQYVVRFSAINDENKTSYCDIKVDANTRDKLNVHLSWDNESDVDLYVTKSDSNWMESCNYMNDNPEWYEDNINNPHLDRDDTDGYGPEVIQIEEPKDDRYTVGARLYWSDGPTKITIKIKCLNEYHTFTKTLKETNEYWIVKDIVWKNNGCIIEAPSIKDGI